VEILRKADLDLGACLPKGLELDSVQGLAGRARTSQLAARQLANSIISSTYQGQPQAPLPQAE
jgi:hypothetical protein